MKNRAEKELIIKNNRVLKKIETSDNRKPKNRLFHISINRLAPLEQKLFAQFS
jgi:hypothetical protein